MIEETGRVVAVRDGLALVEAERKSVCGSCAVNKGCGTAVLGKVLGTRRNRVAAVNTIGAEVGETVVLAIEEDALVRGSLAVYGLPLLLMLALGFGVEQVFALGGILTAETGAILGGLGGLALGFLILTRLSAAMRRDPRYQPRVVRRLGQPQASATLVIGH